MENRNFELFKKSLDEMVSEISRKTDRCRANVMKDYSKEDILRIIDDGDRSELRKISEYFFYNSGFYKRQLIYFSTMLLYQTMVIPINISDRMIKKKKAVKIYNSVLNFIEGMDLKNNLSEIFLELMIYGEYYGLIFENIDGDILFRKLPLEYCRSCSRTFNNTRIVEFNLEFFNTFTSKDDREEVLQSMPKEVKKAYNLYLKGKSSKWVKIEPLNAVCFRLYDGRPPLIAVIPQIINVEEYRGLDRDREKQDLQRLLVHKIPLGNDGELIFNMPEVAELHRKTCKMLSNSDHIDVLTTFGDVTVPQLKDTRATVQDTIDKVERSMYSEAGVSKEIFSPEGSLSLTMSIKNDLAWAMNIAEMFTNWLNFFVNYRFANNFYKFSISILPISYYNVEEMNDLYLKNAQSGYSKILPALSSGFSQQEIINELNFENDYLDISKILVPLQTSFTQSNEGAGAPEKKIEDKSEKTIDNQESIDNQGGQ